MKIIKLFTFIILGLSLANLLTTNTLVNYSDEIRTLSQDIQELEKSNQNLRIKLAESSSLTVMSEKLRAEGYTETAPVATIDLDSSVALNE